MGDGDGDDDANISGRFFQRAPRGWNDYKFGYGSLNGDEMWIGLEYVNNCTS